MVIAEAIQSEMAGGSELGAEVANTELSSLSIQYIKQQLSCVRVCVNFETLCLAFLLASCTHC